MSMQGQGRGSFLLVGALKRAVDVPAVIVIRAVEVDAIDEHARTYNRKYGFFSLHKVTADGAVYDVHADSLDV